MGEVIKEWQMALVVATAGHVWIVRSIVFDGHFFHCSGARTVREWGTSKGLNELVNGPTPNTVLDAQCDVLTVVAPAMIAIIPVRDTNWTKHL